MSFMVEVCHLFFMAIGNFAGLSGQAMVLQKRHKALGVLMLTHFIRHSERFGQAGGKERLENNPVKSVLSQWEPGPGRKTQESVHL